MLRMLTMIAVGLISLPAVASPLVIGHRGASGERPEHTLASYRLAIEEGADFIEPDLVMTKDKQLVARHENEISGTTDVAAHPEFADRKTTKTIDGQSVTGWFTEDFTLAELKTLRARERLPELRRANTSYDGQFEIPTFQQILDLVAEHNAKSGKHVGIYPEIKHGTYFSGLKLNMEAPLVAILKKNGYTKATDPIFIQSFEVGNLERLRATTSLRLVQLIDTEGGPADRPELSYAAMITPDGLAEVAHHADAIGVAKALIVPRGPDGRSQAPTQLIDDAHKAGLMVHVWTFRAENAFLPTELRATGGPEVHGDLTAELRQFFALGIDAAFSDYPGIAVSARGNNN